MYSVRSLFTLFGMVGLAASCEAFNNVEKNANALSCESDDGCLLSQVCDPMTKACVLPPATKNLDVLFLIDNSPSMAPRQKALAANFQAFIQKLDDSGADYHVAIATSDIGSTAAPGLQWTGGPNACNTFSGDDGVLQAIPCSNRPALSQEARKSCETLCPDPSFVPTAGQFYISKVGGTTNVPPYLATDMRTGKTVDYGPQRTFQCLALVGDSGCGLEGQLESSKRALDGHRWENSGFLRPGSMLAVIYITDEDDCSVQAARRSENNPQTHDCTAPDANASFDCFNVDFRCMARDVVCDQPLNTPGAKTNCHERTDSYLEPVQKYVDFFSALRPSNRLFISGIWTLPALGHGGQLTVAAGVGGGSGSPALYRTPQACGTDSATPPGAPQLRLSKLAQKFKGSIEVNLCDEGHYPEALDNMATTMLLKAGLITQ